MGINRLDAYIVLYKKFVEKNMLLPSGAARIEKFLNAYNLSSGEVYDFFMDFAKSNYK